MNECIWEKLDNLGELVTANEWTVSYSAWIPQKKTAHLISVILFGKVIQKQLCSGRLLTVLSGNESECINKEKENEAILKIVSFSSGFLTMNKWWIFDDFKIVNKTEFCKLTLKNNKTNKKKSIVENSTKQQVVNTIFC